MSAAPAKNVAAVKERSGGVCEGCGVRPATDVHHRRYRSRGGGHEVSNLLHLCGGESGLAGGNHSGCHGVAHRGAGALVGWSVESGPRAPGEYEVEHAAHGRVLLKDDGTVVRVEVERWGS